MTLLVLLGASAARAQETGFTSVSNDIQAHRGDEVELEAHGFFRTRADAFYNLDLDRGLTPSGEPLFPVPLSDPDGQFLTHADMRLRTDLAMYAPGELAAVKARINALDNLGLGSTPRGIPSATRTQRSPDQPIAIERLYGEVLLPIGLLTVGRMGSDWGLGILSNGGDCLDCDNGDSADRVGFSTSLLGHLWGVAFDWSASGPYRPRRARGVALDLDPADNVRSVTFAWMSYKTPLARRRRRRAGRVTFEYGAWASHRWQDRDVPIGFLTEGKGARLTPGQSVRRGAKATAVDGWLRLTFPHGRIEAEAVALFGKVEHPSLLPGVELRDPIRSRQLGAAVESEWGAPTDDLSVGLDAGYASGDPAPGFGAFIEPGDRLPQQGDLSGPQAAPPRDTRVDDFAFHPDYRIDRILFREIIGTVTDAFYLRPRMRWTMARLGRGRLTFRTAMVASFAAEQASAPGGERPLGIEIDPDLTYEADGFYVSLQYAILVPLSGLDNPMMGLDARPAQRTRALLAFVY